MPPIPLRPEQQRLADSLTAAFSAGSHIVSEIWPTEGREAPRFHHLTRHREPFCSAVAAARDALLAPGKEPGMLGRLLGAKHASSWTSESLLEAAGGVLVAEQWDRECPVGRALRNFSVATVLDHWNTKSLALIEESLRSEDGSESSVDYGPLDWLPALFGLEPLILEPVPKKLQKLEPYHHYQSELDRDYVAWPPDPDALPALESLMLRIVNGEVISAPTRNRNRMLFVRLGLAFLHVRGRWTPQLHEAATRHFHEGTTLGGTLDFHYDLAHRRLAHSSATKPLLYGFLHPHPTADYSGHPLVAGAAAASRDMLVAAEAACDRELTSFSEGTGPTEIDEYPFLSRIAWLKGFHWILRGLRGAVADERKVSTRNVAIRLTKRTIDYGPAENPEQCVESLKSFPASFLARFADNCRLSPNPFEIVLRDAPLEQCRLLLRQLAIETIDTDTSQSAAWWKKQARGQWRLLPASNDIFLADPFDDSDEPDDGIIDVPFYRDALTAFPPSIVNQALKLLKDQTSSRWTKFGTLLDALVGPKGDRLDKLLAKDNQAAIKSLGAVPLPDGHAEREGELLRRYLQFLDVKRRANRAGSGKRAKLQAAVQAGLANLASNAGYPSADALAWEMELSLARDPARLPQTEAVVPEGRLFLTTVKGESRVAIEAGAKIKVTIPKEIKKTAAFQTLEATAKSKREQRIRFLTYLEEAMVYEIPFAVERLQEAAEKFDLTVELGSLLVATGDGLVGRLQPLERSLQLLDGSTFDLGQSSITICHPVWLASRGQLEPWHAWQKRHSLQQCLSQLDRHWFAPLPGEKEATETARFAAELPGPAARAAFKRFGWRTDTGIPHRLFSPEKTAVTWDITERRYEPGDPYKLDQVVFLTHLRDAEPAQIPFGEVKPNVFSEAIRDITRVLEPVQS